MTVALQDPINQFVISSVGQTTGPWTWQLNAAEDLTVFKLPIATGITEELVLDTDYTVELTDLGNKLGGTITFIGTQIPPAIGDIWTLQRDTVLRRTKDFATSGDFQAVTVNPQFDDPILMVQDTQREALTAVRKNPGIGDDLDPLITALTDRRALVLSDTGGGNFEIIPSTFDPDQAQGDAEGFAEDAQNSADTAFLSAGESAGFANNSSVSASNSLASANDSAVSAAESAASAASSPGLFSKVVDVQVATAYSGNLFDVSSEDNIPTAVTWNNDGTKFYVVGDQNNRIYEYAVKVGFDLTSTVTFNGFFPVQSNTISPAGMTWSNNGARLYLVAEDFDEILEFNVPTPFDILSGVNNTGQTVFVQAQDTSMQGMAWNDDGTKFFLVGDQNNTVYEYVVNSPFDFSSGVAFNNESFSVGDDETSPTGIAFSNDGRKFFIVGTSAQTVLEYLVSTPFDLSSGVIFSSEFFDVSSEDTAPQGISFNNDGTKFFIAGSQNDNIYEYDLVGEFSLSGDSDFSGESFVVTTQETSPTGMAWNNDGKKFFVVGNNSDALFEYATPIPFDLTNASFSGNSFDVSGEDANPQDITWNNDGTKFFILGDGNNRIFEYTASNPFDLSTGGELISKGVDTSYSKTVEFATPTIKNFVPSSFQVIPRTFCS